MSDENPPNADLQSEPKAPLHRVPVLKTLPSSITAITDKRRKEHAVETWENEAKMDFLLSCLITFLEAYEAHVSISVDTQEAIRKVFPELADMQQVLNGLAEIPDVSAYVQEHVPKSLSLLGHPVPENMQVLCRFDRQLRHALGDLDVDFPTVRGHLLRMEEHGASHNVLTSASIHPWSNIASTQPARVQGEIA